MRVSPAEGQFLEFYLSRVFTQRRARSSSLAVDIGDCPFKVSSLSFEVPNRIDDLHLGVATDRTVDVKVDVGLVRSRSSFGEMPSRSDSHQRVHFRRTSSQIPVGSELRGDRRVGLQSRCGCNLTFQAMQVVQPALVSSLIGVVAEERIVSMSIVGDPRVNGSMPLIAEVVSVVVLAEPSRDEHVRQQERIDLYGVSRSIDVAVPMDESNGGEDDSPLRQSVIPVTRPANVTARSPKVPRWNPNPIAVSYAPIAGPPGIVPGAVIPATWIPEIVVAGGRRARSIVDVVGRRRKVNDLLFSIGGPESTHPLPATFDIGPVARNPLVLVRSLSPDPGYPDEVFLHDIPAPVAWNPNVVIPFGANFGWLLIDPCGGLFGHDHCLFAVDVKAFRVGFVEGASKKRRYPFYFLEFFQLVGIDSPSGSWFASDHGTPDHRGRLRLSRRGIEQELRLGDAQKEAGTEGASQGPCQPLLQALSFGT